MVSLYVCMLYVYKLIMQIISDIPQNVPSIEEQCKYPGCSKPKCVENRKIHDFCGKRHAEMSKKEQLDRESSGMLSAENKDASRIKSTAVIFYVR